jgi:hypothetical protein
MTWAFSLDGHLATSLVGKVLPPLRGIREGEVSPSCGDGGVMGHRGAVAHDPSARYAGTSPARSPRRGRETEFNRNGSPLSL